MRSLTCFLAAFAMFFPTAILAACQGQDLRATLAPAAHAEMTAHAAANPFPEGNLWQARKGDQTITLVGTMHIHDPRMVAVVDRLTPTILDSDLLLVEITEAEESVMQKAISTDPSIAFLTDGPTLIDRLPSDVWADLAKAAQARGIPSFMAAKYQPWFLSLTLALAPCALADLQLGKPGLDKMILSAAAAARVPTQGLETFQEVFALLSADPIDVQLSYLPLAAQMAQDSQDVTATTITSYFEEKPAELLAFSRVYTREQADMDPDEFDDLFDKTMKALLDIRNLNWMTRIDQITAKKTMIAVGAAHLPGETGLLNQLALRGYELERLPF